MVWFYHILLWIIDGLLPLAALFSSKVKAFYIGRKGLFDSLIQFRENHPGNLVWFHVASLGEFEQAKPLIELWKTKEPDTVILVSFFSPSGYIPLARKKDGQVDAITYLPLDRKKYARRFLDIIQPSQAFFVKYDLWHQFLSETSRRKIPLFLISASFREDQIYFRRAGFFRKSLFFFDHIFTQNEKSGSLLAQIGYSKFSWVGDTRFDRVWARAQAPQNYPEIKKWIENKKVIVLGSVWEEDMALLIPLINAHPEFRWIIAPHSMDKNPMKEWKEKITLSTQFFTEWNHEQAASVLFVDTIGMLASLYQYAYIAYVGGAFGTGLHNILEPIGFGVPVIFGKVRKAGKFPEAEEARERGCGFQVQNYEELEAYFRRLEIEEFYGVSQKSAREWVQSNRGVAQKIFDFTTNLR
ncbi:MAG: 3-deoxy-D-manno-octulosonic acid transferase [Algoriphagus sp.]|uniref:3-deoxy-D-manno-octulosonic acid transferase n=1 Tax=Algoriphagus sp. TaxID=1872435 RepID=UPI0017A2E297|nr:glycosyltransferase N-terminal domain-containing protein [Algoriphagus sp.]NVJ86946.1 3-deoxy-D-manno-octulosonic acid transferase [Algoriphagus sp.]